MKKQIFMTIISVLAGDEKVKFLFIQLIGARVLPVDSFGNGNLLLLEDFICSAAYAVCFELLLCTVCYTILCFQFCI